MKTVVMNVSIAGHGSDDLGIDDFSFSPGETVELPDGLAEAWIKSGHASEPAEIRPRKTGRTRRAVEQQSEEQSENLETSEGAQEE